MNDVLKTLLNRRSVRSYSPEQIKEEDLQAILEAGQFAPSAMNEQPWHFTVVQNKDVLQKITEATKKAMNRNTDPFYGAPTLILVFADKNAIAPVQDASLAIGNMLNAAASLGVSSCWIHAVNALFAGKEALAFTAELGIPEDTISVGSLVLGSNAGSEPVASSRKENTINFIR